MAPMTFFTPLFCLSVLGTTDLSAAESDANATATVQEEHWLATKMDAFHHYWSHKVLLFSSGLDSFFLDGFDSNETPLDEENNESLRPFDSEAPLFPKPTFKKEENKATYQTSAEFDEFFKDQIYLDATNKSYVRIRAGYEYDKRGDSSFVHNVSARLRLPRTKDKLQLFIGDDEPQDQSDPTKIQQTDKTEGVGIRYFFPALYGRLYSNASIGFSGIDNPYVKTHLEYPIFLDEWLFKASQNFKYSLENKFDEWTTLYLDRKVLNNKIIRISTQRSTNSEIRGMEYTAQISYRNTLKHDIGYNYYIAANGRTKDLPEALYDNGLIPQEGVYNYSTGVVWRQAIRNNYLFYQVEPIVSFHEQYDYKPNYLMRLSLELYFGNR
ncbi:MAG: hypothetical protein JXK04_05790 [Campylobacterales bacterium]|nr:hypothetical protein [Campylobacterales bacterium]